MDTRELAKEYRLTHWAGILQERKQKCMPASVLAVLPVLLVFLFFQKSFIATIVLSGAKG